MRVSLIPVSPMSVNCAAGAATIPASPAGMPSALDTFSASSPPTIPNKIFGGVRINIFRDGELLSETDSLSRRAFEAMDGVMIKTVLDDNGRLNIGGRLRGAFIEHPNARINLRLRNGHITTAFILKPDGTLGEAIEYSLVYEASGRLIHSYHKALHWPYFARLENHIMVTRLNDGGILTIGQKYCGQFSRHANHIAVVKIRGGLIAEVAFPCKSRIRNVEVDDLKGRSQEYSRIHSADGRLMETYNAQLRHDKLTKLKDNIVLTFLDRLGTLNLGHMHAGCFRDHRSGIAAVTIADGVVTSVTLLKFAKISNVQGINWEPEDIKREVAFQLVLDQTGRAIGSFASKYFIPLRFRNHLGKIKGQMAVNHLNGFLYGNKYYSFESHGDLRGSLIREIAFKNRLKPGEATQFKIERPDGTLIEIEAEKILQQPDVDWAIEVIWPSRGEGSGRGYKAKPQRHIGAVISDPETEVIRSERIEMMRRALGIFTNEERMLLLDAAILYHSRRSRNTSKKVDPLLLIQEFVREKDTLIEIAIELEVSTEWLLGNFQRLAKEIKPDEV